MGLRGVLNFFYPKSYYFCDLKPHAKFRNPTITPSGRKVCGGENRNKNNQKYSGHFNSLQRLRAAHTLRSDQWLVGELSLYCY